LCVGQQRSLLEILELNFKHVDPSALRSHVIRKGIVGEWPSVTFSPESVHESVNELNLRIAVEFRRQCANQSLERLLKSRMIVARLVSGVRVGQIFLSQLPFFLIA